jgi:hypothetical protein
MASHWVDIRAPESSMEALTRRLELVAA